jgi:hypothetical protein
LKPYNNRWFLLGTVDGYQSLTNLAINRICSIAQVGVAYILNTTWNFEEYFEDVVGVTRFENVEAVKTQLAF